MKYTARMMMDLLKTRHSSDKWVTVPECKIGSSQNMSYCQRLDMWTMAKSYAHPRFIGYEVKVSRQDFLNDNKWPGYLKYCREFYFVCPPGIIEKEELPPEVGLLVCSKNAKMLCVKKKAPIRDVEIPKSILYYILISRTDIRSEHTLDAPNAGNLEFWKEFLKNEAEGKNIGGSVSRKISKMVKSRVGDIEKENRALKRENDKLQSCKKVVKDLGFNINGFIPLNSFRKVLVEAVTGVPVELTEQIDNTAKNLKLLHDALKKKMEVCQDKPKLVKRKGK